MSHPARFKDDDPLLRRVREICLSYPKAAERVSHGRPNWYVKTAFAWFGGTVKGDHGSRFDRSLLVKPDRLEREALLQDQRCFDPAYLGPSGWVGLDLTNGRPDWDEVCELIDASYRATAPATLVRDLPEQPL